MSQNYQRDVSSLQVILGEHLLNLSQLSSIPKISSQELQTPLHLLEALSWVVYREDKVIMKELDKWDPAQPEGIWKDSPREWRAQCRFERLRIVVAALYDKDVLRKAQLPWDDVGA